MDAFSPSSAFPSDNTHGKFETTFSRTKATHCTVRARRESAATARQRSDQAAAAAATNERGNPKKEAEEEEVGWCGV